MSDVDLFVRTVGGTIGVLGMFAGFGRGNFLLSVAGAFLLGISFLPD